MLSLTLFAALVAADPTVAPATIELEPVGSDLVPLPPKLPAGLPTSIEVTEPVAGVLLPHPLDAAVNDLIDYCTAPERYPAVVRTALDRVREVEAISCNGRLSVASTQWRAAQVRAQADTPAWSTWKVVGIAAGVLAIGLVVGFGVGVSVK